LIFPPILTENLTPLTILSLTFQEFTCKKFIPDIFTNRFKSYKSGADTETPFSPAFAG